MIWFSPISLAGACNLLAGAAPEHLVAGAVVFTQSDEASNRRQIQ
jgi:hypothetical protein